MEYTQTNLYSSKGKRNGKFPLEQTTKAQMGVGDQRQAPAALPPEKTRYPLYRRLGGPQGRYGRVRKISPPPGFDPQNVQPIAIRYTDCAIPALLIFYLP